MAERERSLEVMDVNLRAFWSGRRVLVTGHTGFKGGWLCLWLSRLGARVHGFSLPAPTQPSLFESARLGDCIESTIGDIRDDRELNATMSQVRPEVVFHLAAQPLVRHSYLLPVDTYLTNVLGTVLVLESARRTPSVKVVVNVTSDKCYENLEQPRGYHEQDALGGYDPYSSSKACAEIVSAAYRRSFLEQRKDGGPIALATARAGNVIGGGDWAVDRLIPDVVRSIASHRPMTVRNPDATRPWQHVLEPLSGYLLLAQRLSEGDPSIANAWNFGPGDQDVRPVSWVLARWSELWGRGFEWQVESEGHPHEAKMLSLDTTKALKRLGWSPRWRLETGLARTVGWYRAWMDGKDMRAESIRQIEEFEACR